MYRYPILPHALPHSAMPTYPIISHTALCIPSHTHLSRNPHTLILYTFLQHFVRRYTKCCNTFLCTPIWLHYVDAPGAICNGRFCPKIGHFLSQNLDCRQTDLPGHSFNRKNYNDQRRTAVRETPVSRQSWGYPMEDIH